MGVWLLGDHVSLQRIPERRIEVSPDIRTGSVDVVQVFQALEQNVKVYRCLSPDDLCDRICKRHPVPAVKEGFSREATRAAIR